MRKAPAATARDTAFAAIALLCCRDRVARVLDAVAEPRRSEIGRAIAEFEDFDNTHLKQRLAAVIRRQDEVFREEAVQVLGSTIAKAPRVVLKWIAQRTKQ